MHLPEGYKLRLADSLDHLSILDAYRLTTQALEQIGIYQWNDEYPDHVTLQSDIDTGHQWVLLHNDSLAGAMTLDGNQDPQYDHIKWAYTSENVLVIHRLCVHPAHQSRGLGRYMIRFAEQYALENEYEVIRFDAYIGNPYSQRLYRTMNYTEAIGYCYYHPGQIMCNCFEKRIKF